MISVEALKIILLVLVLIAIAVAWTVVAIWIGFRMGRQVAEKPIPSIIEKKSAPLVEEDPYYEAMHGVPQKRIPTVEG